MSGVVRVLISCFLVLQFSLLSAVDVWAMTLPMDAMSHAAMSPEKNMMDLDHCQSDDPSDVMQQCRCSSCACIPLVIGVVIPPAESLVLFSQLFSRLSTRFYRIHLVPPFRPPIV